MSSDLIFHPISKRNWKEFNQGGYFDPKGTKYEDGIICVQADDLKTFINENFQGRRQVLILVIDKSRLQSRVSLNKERGQFKISERINLDAILDKVMIKPNKEGIFDIEVSED